jgi:hypothetical protein
MRMNDTLKQFLEIYEVETGMKGVLEFTSGQNELSNACTIEFAEWIIEKFINGSENDSEEPSE